MENLTIMAQLCFCFPDCDTTKFSFTEKQLPLNVEKLCQKSLPNHMATIMKTASVYTKFTKLQLALQSIENTGKMVNLKNYTKGYNNYCKSFLFRDVSILRVRMESHTVTKLKRNLRVTVTDKLGSIGGTLGLLTGFSTLACIEVFHWMVKIGYNVIHKWNSTT